MVELMGRLTTPKLPYSCYHISRKMGRGSHSQCIDPLHSVTTACVPWRVSEGWMGVVPQGAVPTWCLPKHLLQGSLFTVLYF